MFKNQGNVFQFLGKIREDVPLPRPLVVVLHMTVYLTFIMHHSYASIQEIASF